jgi:hypothetical protein
MASGTARKEQSLSTNHLKSIFDESLAMLSDGEDSVRPRRSSLPLRIDMINLRKRALSDAADALAALWKISAPRSAKLPSRDLQYGR